MDNPWFTPNILEEAAKLTKERQSAAAVVQKKKERDRKRIQRIVQRTMATETPKNQRIRVNEDVLTATIAKLQNERSDIRTTQRKRAEDLQLLRQESIRRKEKADEKLNKHVKLLGKQFEKTNQMREDHIEKTAAENEKLFEQELKHDENIHRDVDRLYARMNQDSESSTSPLRDNNNNSIVATPKIASPSTATIILAISTFGNDGNPTAPVLLEGGKELPVEAVYELVGDCVVTLVDGTLGVYGYEPSAMLYGRNKPATPGKRHKHGLVVKDKHVVITKIASDGESTLLAFANDDKAYVFDYKGEGCFRLVGDITMPCQDIQMGTTALTLLQQTQDGPVFRHISTKSLRQQLKKKVPEERDVFLLGKTMRIPGKTRTHFALAANSDTPLALAFKNSTDKTGLGFHYAATKRDDNKTLRSMQSHFTDGQIVQLGASMDYQYALHVNGPLFWRPDVSSEFQEVFGETLGSPSNGGGQPARVLRMATGGISAVCWTSDNRIVHFVEYEGERGGAVADDEEYFGRSVFDVDAIRPGSKVVSAKVSTQAVVYALTQAATTSDGNVKKAVVVKNTRVRAKLKSKFNAAGDDDDDKNDEDGDSSSDDESDNESSSDSSDDDDGDDESTA